jgi:transcriptional regulator with XRE-family HTH domain
MPALSVRLGQTVRELRKSAGYSQEGFAAAIKVHRTFMGSIERGKTNVSLETLERLARGLDLKVWELLQKTETRSAGAVAALSREESRRRKASYNQPSTSRKVAE